MPILIVYLNKKGIAREIEKAIRTLHKDLMLDARFASKKPFLNSSEQWDFYSKTFLKNTDKLVRSIIKKLLQFPEIKKAISKDDLYTIFIEGGLGARDSLYTLAFRDIPLLIPIKEEKTGTKFKIQFEPRNITLRSIIKDKREMESFIALIDQTIATSVKFYKDHKCIACMRLSNIKMEPGLKWSFAGVDFHSGKDENFKDYPKWLGGEGLKGDLDFFGLRRGKDLEKKIFAMIKFDGCSSYKAFGIALTYFNKVFNILRLIAELQLRRYYYTSRESLDIPEKVVSIESSKDYPMSSAITPDLDNDFYVAVQENSIYLPLVLDKKVIENIENYPFKDELSQLLERSFLEREYEIDKKIFDALSWFSESLKNFIIPHKIVGLITALETLLTSTKIERGWASEKSIGELFAERGAIILKDSYEERLLMKKKLKEIYGLRSKIVHGYTRSLMSSKGREGLIRIETEEAIKLSEIQKLTAEIIVKTISLIEKENIKKLEDLNKYVERKLLS